MKNSGIPWIGEIPKDWKTIQAKFYCDSVYAGGTPDSNNTSYWDGDIPWLPSGVCHDCEVNEAKKFITQEGFENSSTKLIPPHTTIMAMTGATCGNVGYITFEACANQSVVAYIKRSNLVSKYLFYALISAREYILTYQTGGAQAGINVQNCKNFIVPYVPISEQQRIVEFLDRKCSEVNEMIALQEQIIEELKAYKQSVITEAVTKGLNPNVPMKDSGIEWIGEIPEHWEIKKIKHLSHVVRGGSPRPAGDLRYYVGNIPFMKVADITKDDKIYVDKCEYTIKEAGLSHTRMIKPNTLLLTNSGATLGVPKINTFDTTFNDGIAAFLNLDISLDIIFAYYSLKARTQYFLDSASLGIGQPNLNTDIIGSTYLLVPPIPEQQIIVDFLNEKCANIDALISIKQRKIESLKEYKKSIIYEYVTGKKEVK